MQCQFDTVGWHIPNMTLKLHARGPVTVVDCLQTEACVATATALQCGHASIPSRVVPEKIAVYKELVYDPKQVARERTVVLTHLERTKCVRYMAEGVELVFDLPLSKEETLCNMDHEVLIDNLRFQAKLVWEWTTLELFDIPFLAYCYAG